MSVIIETSIGDITVDLYIDERPRCCMNFLKLCKIKYYNFSLFHTVQQNVVAQTGDPTATGRGGESIFAKLYGEQARFFDMEVVPRIKHHKKGLISMVNNGSGMHGSQFFFTLADNLDYLDDKHTVFGEVAEGFDIIEKFNTTFCGEDNRPHQDIRIYHTIILDDPYDDPDALEVPAVSPGPTEEMLNSDHIPCDANIDEDKDKTEAEVQELMAEKEAKANTQILEMVGDLPDAEVAPPENVLFVCKLNPVTTAEDLEIIFSRFGPIVSCEVIKDSKTGESLQYAFIEFEKEEHCESAYFKMDNVLIDDRRIHVDFSQSVSKLKWKGKGKGVEILPTGDAPVYVLKNQQRQNDGYDLVYEHEGAGDKAVKKDQKKKKKSTKHSDDDDNKNSRKDNKRNRSQSNSPDFKKKYVPERSYKEDKRRDDYRDDYRDVQDRKKDEYKDRLAGEDRRNRGREEENEYSRRWTDERKPRSCDGRRKDERGHRRDDAEHLKRKTDFKDDERRQSKKSYDDSDDDKQDRRGRNKWEKDDDKNGREGKKSYLSKRRNSDSDSDIDHHSKIKKKKDLKSNKSKKHGSSDSDLSDDSFTGKKKSDTLVKKKKKSKKKHRSKGHSDDSTDD
ncbi:Peptidyl-prolyl cis-trans isomerase-like 4 [Bulinus truncatus]|nr:Peptidyl-prolyl cis-trans isomerase-like 4 [Bulinus truncatus]